MDFIKSVYGALEKGGLFGAGLLCTFFWKKRYLPDYMVFISSGITSLGFCSLVWHIFEEGCLKKRKMRGCKELADELGQIIKSEMMKKPREVMNVDEIAKAEERQLTTQNEEQSEETSQMATKSPAEGNGKLLDISDVSGRLKTCANDFVLDKKDKFGIGQICNRLLVLSAGFFHQSSAENRRWETTDKEHVVKLEYAEDLPETSPLKHESDASPNTETVNEFESDKLAKPVETTHGEIIQETESKVKQQISLQQMLADETVIKERLPTTRNEETDQNREREMRHRSPADGEERFVSPKIIAMYWEHLKACEEFGLDAVPRPVNVSSCSEGDAKKLEIDEMEFKPLARMGTGNEESENKMAKSAETTCEETGVDGESSDESSDLEDQVFQACHVFKGWDTHRANFDKEICRLFNS